MSYSDPPPPPPNYGAPPPPPEYGGQPGGFGGQPPKTSVLAIFSLVTGIVGLCCAGLLLPSIAAVVLGSMARKEIAGSGGTKRGSGLALAGLILGAIGIVLGIVNWILIATGVVDLNTTFETTS